MSGGKIVVLGTGGTIAGRAAAAHDNIGYTAAQLGIGELLQGVQAAAGRELVAEQLAQVDSKDMDLELWRRLALRCAHWLGQEEVAGVVVTHGTDTLEETAYFLHCVLPAGKPVVLTGAMRPATSAQADGPQNLADALTLAAHPHARGVLVVFAGSIHDPRDAAKVHPYRAAAFGSGDAGPLGYLEEGRLRQLRPWPPGEGQAGAAWLHRLSAGAAWPRVEIVMNYAGAVGAAVEALVAQGLDGIVAAGTGNGSLHRELEAALLRAQAAGVRVVRSTRCPEGRVLGQAGERIAACELPPLKARIRLLLELLR